MSENEKELKCDNDLALAFIFTASLSGEKQKARAHSVLKMNFFTLNSGVLLSVNTVHGCFVFVEVKNFSAPPLRLMCARCMCN
jgi:hypothetical protein